MALASSTRRLVVTIGAVITLATAGACSGGEDAVPGGNGDSEQAQGLLDRAPVASADELGQGTTAAAIKERGELLVGGSLDAPLLSQQNPTTGETEGFDATLGKLLAKYITGKPNSKIINAGSETREALLQNNTVDTVFQTYSITPERAEKVSFAGPYLVSGQAIATKNGDSKIKNSKDLNGKTVIAGANTPAVNALKEVAPNAEVVTFGTDPECVQALEQGRGDAYVQDLTLLAADAQLNDKIQIVGEPFSNEPYGIGLRHGDDQFKEFVNGWLRKLQESGIWQQAWKESLGTVVEGDAPQPPEIGSVPGT